MTHKLLKDAGEVLYGPRWQSQMARDLNVSDRTVRRWAQGAVVPKKGHYLDLIRVAKDRVMALEALVDLLKDAGGESSRGSDNR